MSWKALVGLILAFFGVISIGYYVVQTNATHDAYATLEFLLLGFLLVVTGLFTLSRK